MAKEADQHGESFPSEFLEELSQSAPSIRAYVIGHQSEDDSEWQFTPCGEIRNLDNCDLEDLKLLVKLFETMEQFARDAAEEARERVSLIGDDSGVRLTQ